MTGASEMDRLRMGKEEAKEASSIKVETITIFVQVENR